MPVGGVAFVAREVGSGQVVLVKVLCAPEGCKFGTNAGICGVLLVDPALSGFPAEALSGSGRA